jgi:hypothetical protein
MARPKKQMTGKAINWGKLAGAAGNLLMPALSTLVQGVAEAGTQKLQQKIAGAGLRMAGRGRKGKVGRPKGSKGKKGKK